ncbi:hypothetical protein NG799_03435 [Laspinema sp. D1]|uniref:Uncharacterized protein n=1 Tax=Laspinema palackyanum D2a TaxID=2953684 RepID=A0ABT2MNA9_9CYAN|nr:hypothetical protein [Laspinema sp. D2b]MCT7965386.1 hypothetical protein [Laspinema sp. D2a]
MSIPRRCNEYGKWMETGNPGSRQFGNSKGGFMAIADPLNRLSHLCEWKKPESCHLH